MVDYTSHRKRPPTAWHNAKMELRPDGTMGAAPPPAEATKKDAAAEPEAVPVYIKEGSQAEGWRRVLRYVRALRAADRSEDDIRVAAAKFVQEYPSTVRRVDADYWSGMQAALHAYRSQDPAFWRGMH